MANWEVVLALFTAVRDCALAGGRFLWIRNLARPDVFLTLAVTAVTSATVALHAGSAGQSKTFIVVVPAIVTLFVLSRLSAGVGLYWGVSSLASLLQTALVRRQKTAV